MANAAVRIGVIGTGMIGKRHLENYAGIDGAQVVAVADLDEAEARKVAAQHGVPDAYAEYRRLLDRDDIDAVDVCLHNQLHRPVTVDALSAGKHVYCEKPIAAKYADGIAMVEAAKNHGRKLHIQLSSIYRSDVRAARSLVEEGLLGEVYHGRAYVNLGRCRPYVDGYGTPHFVNRKTSGGGALIDWGIYVIGRVLFVMGNPKPLRITGTIYDKLPMDEQRRADSGYDVEEMGVGFVRLEGGATLDVLAAWALNLGKGPGCSVAGSLGGISLPPMAAGKNEGDVKFFHSHGNIEFESGIRLGELERRWKHVRGFGDSFESSQHHWIRALQGRVELLPTAEIALNMILIAEGIYLSSGLGREVTVEETIAASKQALGAE